MIITESKVKKSLLTVWSEADRKTGEVAIFWKYLDRPNCYMLMGVLTTIINDLDRHISEKTSEDIKNGNYKR